MKTIIPILLILLVFNSCSTSERINRHCRQAKLKYEIAATKWDCPKDLDSTFIQSQVIIKDTTIFVPVPGQAFHDSIPVIITKGLMNSPVSLLETTYSRSRAWVENGILKHTLDQTPSTIPVILPGAIHTSISNTVQTIKVPYYVDRPTSKPLHWWQKLFIWSGVIAWWVVGLYIVKKFYKFKMG
jgi:hypothetical protein